MKLFDPTEKVHANSRPIWHEALAEIGAANPNVVALTADLSRSVCTENFRKSFPDRYFNVGISEQNMVGMAAGLAMNGKIPYCSSFAPFLTMRAIEQFRTDVCYMGLNVRLVAAYGGIAITGPTHSGLEDAGIIRGIANSTVVCPSDVTMMRKVFHASVDYDGPMYIRMGEGTNDAEIYGEDYEFKIGKAIVARPGKDATIISFGLVLRYAVEAAMRLEKEGVDVGVIDMHTLKPLDKQAILEAAAATGRIVTVEDHSVYNGLGSAVAETLADEGISCKLKRLGIPDVYPSYGLSPQLHKKYGYGTDGVIAAVKGLL